MHITTGKRYLYPLRRSAHFVEADDGRVYRIVPISERRGLAGKVLGQRLAMHINIPSVDIAIVELDEGFVRRAQVACESDAAPASLKAGTYFGSAPPVDPRRTAIFDILPRNMYPKVANIRDFSVMRPLDLWIGNPNPGHSLCIRYPDKCWRAYMIGFDDCFSSANPPIETMMYLWLTSDCLDWDASEAAVPLIKEINADVLGALTADIPQAWWQGCQKTRDDTIRWLCARQQHLAETVRDQRHLASTERMRKPPRADNRSVQAFRQSSA